MNKEIAQLRMDGIEKGIMTDFLEELVPQTCGKEATPKIDGYVLGTLFAILLGPIAFAMFASQLIGFALERFALPERME